MAQYAMNAYDADVYITDFKGMMQYGDQMQSDLRYSPDCMNVETPGGVLQPGIKWDGVKIKLKTASGEPEYLDPATVGTLMYIRDRNPAVIEVGVTTDYETNVGESVIVEKKSGRQTISTAGRDVYVIAANKKLFSFGVIGDLREYGEYEAEEITGTGELHTDRWSWCTYEMTFNIGGESVVNNVLIFSNPMDGVFMYNPAGTIVTSGTSRVFKRNVAGRIQTPAYFSWIEIYADRLWGVGAKGLNNDTIYYSRPYTIANWTQDTANPENGGGEIREPTWDKDYLVALKAFGDGLIAFTKNMSWKITGSNPLTFNIQRQLGTGCLYPDTIADMGQYLLYLGKDSLVSYDGYQVRPFMKEATYEIFRKIGWDEFIKPYAVRNGDKYVLCMSSDIGDNLKDTYAQTFEVVLGLIQPTGTTHEYSQAQKYLNLVYDMTDGTIVCNETPLVVSLCKQVPYALTYEPASTEGTTEIPAANKLCPLKFNSWERQIVTDKAVKWVSPWITFGRNDIQKGGFELYFTPEVRAKKTFTSQWWSSGSVNEGETPSYIVESETTGPVTFSISIQTEKKTKTKTYTVQPLTSAEIAAGKKHKMKRLHFGGSGRRFRLIIEVAAGNTIPWRLIGGIHIIAETDKD